MRAATAYHARRSASRCSNRARSTVGRSHTATSAGTKERRKRSISDDPLAKWASLPTIMEVVLRLAVFSDILPHNADFQRLVRKRNSPFRTSKFGRGDPSTGFTRCGLGDEARAGLCAKRMTHGIVAIALR